MSANRFVKRKEHLIKKIDRLEKQHDELRKAVADLKDRESATAASATALTLDLPADVMMNAYALFQEKMLDSVEGDTLYNNAIGPFERMYRTKIDEVREIMNDLVASDKDLVAMVQDTRDGITAQDDVSAQCVAPGKVMKDSLYCFYGGHKPETVRRKMAQLSDAMPFLHIYVCPRHNSEFQDFISRVRLKSVVYHNQMYVYTIHHNLEEPQ